MPSADRPPALADRHGRRRARGTPAGIAAVLISALAAACVSTGGVPPDATEDSTASQTVAAASQTVATASQAAATAATVARSDGLPLIHDHSGASDGRVRRLVKEAIAGLGIADENQAPGEADRFFVGSHYMAWIDQTGFYGEMNGLWRMNAAAGDALDFVTRQDGRPVNFLVVAEDGDGGWPTGYSGAEHIESPNRTLESDDDPYCAQTDWCNMYGLSEAARITDPDIPWWSSCNVASPPWTEVHEPIVERESGDELKLVYEGPLAKVADGDGVWDGDDCGADYLFPDGRRRRVYLRVGYELHGDTDYLDRTLQVRNPAGNPPFDGPMSFIGGFVITEWPDPHPLKDLRFARPETATVAYAPRAVRLPAGRWTALDTETLRDDLAIGWLDQPITLSISEAYVAGGSATLSHVGPGDNADVGFCLCIVHGGLELGGGLIHGGISLPIPENSLSIEAKRRLRLPGGDGR